MFVNHLGQPIDIEAMKKAATKPRRSASAPQEYHKGWRAMGYSPAYFEEGRKAYEAEREEAAKSGRHMPPWSRELHMRKHPPKAIRSKPYEIREAAAQACALAEREGWVACRPVPVAKGA
jgi:hypothetical protein